MFSSTRVHESPGFQHPLQENYEKYASHLQDGICVRFGRIMIKAAPGNIRTSAVDGLAINCTVLLTAKYCELGCAPDDIVCEQPGDKLDALRHCDRHRGFIKAYRVKYEWILILVVEPFHIPTQFLRRAEQSSRGETCRTEILDNMEINIGIEYRASEDIQRAMAAICPRLQATYDERSRIRFVTTFRNPSVPSQKSLELHCFDQMKSSTNLIIEIDLVNRRAVIKERIYSDRRIRQQPTSVESALLDVHSFSHPNNECRVALVKSEECIVKAGLRKNNSLLEDKVGNEMSSEDGLLQHVRTDHDDLPIAQAEARPNHRRKWRIPRMTPDILFYRTSSKRIIHENEELSESDEDMDENSLLLEHSALNCYELARFAEHEQEFVRRLNNFLWRERVVTDSGIYPALAEFIKANKQWILGAFIREEILRTVYDRLLVWKSLNDGQILELQRLLLVSSSRMSDEIEHNVAQNHHPEKQEAFKRVGDTTEWPQVGW